MASRISITIKIKKLNGLVKKHFGKSMSFKTHTIIASCHRRQKNGKYFAQCVPNNNKNKSKSSEKKWSVFNF